MNILQKSSTRKHSGKYILLILLLLLILLSIAGVSFGAVRLDWRAAFQALLTGDLHDMNCRILLHARLPRVLGALLTGMALSVSGVILQALLGNPLAAPNIIGVNSGAGLGVYLALALAPACPSFIPAAAFLGAFTAGLLVAAFSFRAHAGKVTIVLAGVALSAILNAGMDSLITLFPDIMLNASSFKIGSFYGLTMQALVPAVFYILPGLFAALLLAKQLDILSLGDDTATSLGCHVRMVRLLALLTAAVLAGAAVSFSGLIGFVGLIIPHIVRRFTGCRHMLLIPASALLGACFVLLCDLLCRSLFAPYELPVGIMLSLLGGPFLLYLLIHKQKGRLH